MTPTACAEMKRRLRTLVPAFMLFGMNIAHAETDLAKPYIGVWQEDRIMQAHKLAIRPLDCRVKSKQQTISAINKETIEVTGEKATKQFSIQQEGAEQFWATKRRKKKIFWEIPGETFLVNAGHFWLAYRRCDR